jgi:AraC family transcriptional regulator of adaptative response/methylated-DNA-[protein]-cysteine methyltransferase
MAEPREGIDYDFWASRFGECLLARSRRGVCRIDFTDGDRDAALARLAAAHPRARLQPAALESLAAAIFAAESGQPVPLDPGGTAFQRAVWAAVQRIPRGVTRAYGEVAAELGRPSAARAVGQAVARNPLAVLVPCHRVLPASGGPGSYRWGRQRKSALLAWESTAASGAAFVDL